MDPLISTTVDSDRSEVLKKGVRAGTEFDKGVVLTEKYMIDHFEEIGQRISGHLLGYHHTCEQRILSLLLSANFIESDFQIQGYFCDGTTCVNLKAYVKSV